MIESEGSFTIETTLSGKFIYKIISIARKKGYEIELLYIYLPSWKLNRERVDNRVKVGGHDIPTKDIIRRFKRSLMNLPSVLQLVDSWKIYENASCYNLVFSDSISDIRHIKEYFCKPLLSKLNHFS
jgi:predicted ABC-type ATPase